MLFPLLSATALPSSVFLYHYYTNYVILLHIFTHCAKTQHYCNSAHKQYRYYPPQFFPFFSVLCIFAFLSEKKCEKSRFPATLLFAHVTLELK